MYLDNKLREIAQSLFITHFGIADLLSAYKAVYDQGGADIAGFRYCISMGIALPAAIVDRLPDRSERQVAVNYQHHAYDVINWRLDYSASVIASFLQKEGHTALPLPAAERVDDRRICASFSHKLGARLAGLGWIGKSCLLVTPDAGPRVRWVSVLANAPLTPAEKLIEEKCGSCHQCVDICPVKAFTGRAFSKDEPREARYDAQSCEAYFKEMKTSGKAAVCGMCVYVCPYGRK
jgi:epoxyqueuosine reductase QueG